MGDCAGNCNDWTHGIDGGKGVCVGAVKDGLWNFAGGGGSGGDRGYVGESGEGGVVWDG